MEKYQTSISGDRNDSAILATSPIQPNSATCSKDLRVL